MKYALFCQIDQWLLSGAACRTPPEVYVCPVDWRGKDEEYVRALREAYTGREEQTPTEALKPRHEFNEMVKRGWTDSPYTREEYQRLYEKWELGNELVRLVMQLNCIVASLLQSLESECACVCLCV